MASTTYLQRTVSTTGSRRKATFSAWIKKSKLGEQWFLNSGGNNSTGYNIKIGFGSDDEIFIINSSGSTNLRYQTTRRLKDTSAWYHIVVVFDTDNSTSGDRVKVYINGNRETSFFNVTVPSLNLDLEMNQNTSSKNLMAIGTRYNTGDLFDGLMSHVHWIDGTAYDASTFGSTDLTTGEWNINTAPSVNYGTNGFFILKDDNAVTDRSGQGNNFTLGAGTLSKTEDNPSNVFASINNLLGSDVVGSTVSYASANTDVKDPNGSASGINPNFISTLGMPSKGKWYCEVQPLAFSTGSGHSIGIYRTKGSTDDTGEGTLEGDGAKIRYIYADTSIYIIKYGSNDQTGLTSISASQTVGMALDLDNGTLQYYVNGSTRANAITGINSANDGYDYFFHAGLESSSSGRYGRYYWNFGNGSFAGVQLTGTTYQDSQGRGIFKYQPPTNFLALCTRNLNI